MKIKNIKVNELFARKSKEEYSVKRNKGHVLKRIGALALLTISLPLLSSCNRAIIDTKYGQNAALISGDDTAIILDINSWKDYEGEEYQLRLTNGLVTLTSSFDTDLFFGRSEIHSVRNFAKNQLSPNGEIYDFYKDSNKVFNYELIDTNWNFNKAVLFNGNKSVMFNLLNWKDFDGEQLQVVTKDGLVVLLSSYNSKLFYDRQSSMKAEDFAKMYMGSDGSIKTIGEPVENNSFTNKNLIDLNYNFNKIIIIKGKRSIILPVKEWRDYEGEQLQVKIPNGPTILTAAYDSVLVNDSNSQSKAYDIASAISDEVIDLTLGKPLSDGFFNKTIFDFVYGFSTGVISNSNSAASISINAWKDYEGEQLQVIFPNGDTMLTSSVFLDMLNDGTNELNADILADYYGDKVIKSARNLTSHVGINKQVFDFENSFNYALHVENGNVTIIPLKKWKDYYNVNGHKSTERSENPDGTRHRIVTSYSSDEPSPNCEQLQLELPEGSCILTSAYDTILLKTNNVKQYAEMFKGENGVISDLTPIFGSPTQGGWNIKIFDTRWNFNYAIYNSGENSQIFKVSKWMDFADGEQVQVYFTDDGGIVSSYVNLSLVYSDSEKKVEAIANAFAGVEQEKGKTYKYNMR